MYLLYTHPRHILCVQASRIAAHVRTDLRINAPGAEWLMVISVINITRGGFNVLTDQYSWWLQYLVAVFLFCCCCITYSTGAHQGYRGRCDSFFRLQRRQPKEKKKMRASRAKRQDSGTGSYGTHTADWPFTGSGNTGPLFLHTHHCTHAQRGVMSMAKILLFWSGVWKSK